MSIFNVGEFKLANISLHPFKIDCDALTDEDWQSIAYIVSRNYVFDDVFSIETGGNKLAQALQKYRHPSPVHATRALIVDDVLTTGGSMESLKQKLQQEYDNIQGFVLFSRTTPPDWVRSLFHLNPNINY